ncbi:unnamed protein product [Linum trigynum]|uniref:Uncharacterized protein n=1 Tax=Linum trigynum TaxID=586398 RepID=A0AAV2CET6_9ROSI
MGCSKWAEAGEGPDALVGCGLVMGEEATAGDPGETGSRVSGPAVELKAPISSSRSSSSESGAGNEKTGRGIQCSRLEVWAWKGNRSS